MERLVSCGKAARELTHARILPLADDSRGEEHTDERLLAALGAVRTMNGQCLDRRLDSQEAIAAEVAAWASERNAPEARIHWTFTLAAARQKLRKLYPSNEDG